jgi:hypothetical protein
MLDSFTGSQVETLFVLGEATTSRSSMEPTMPRLSTLAPLHGSRLARAKI